MTLSYNLAYLETILVHPNRRQSFANTVQPYWTQDLTPRHTEKSAHDDMFWQKHLIVYFWREHCRCALDLNMLLGWLWLYVSFSISTIYVTFPKSCECERLEANQGIDKVTITKERKILCLAVVNSLSMIFEINSHKYFAQDSFMTGLLMNTWLHVHNSAKMFFQQTTYSSFVHTMFDRVQFTLANSLRFGSIDLRHS